MNVNTKYGSFFQTAQTIMSLFKLCETSRDLKQIHGLIVKRGFNQDMFAVGKIVERCANFGDMDYGVSVFDSVEEPDGFVWNTIIRGFGNTSQPEKALLMYKKMMIMRKRGLFLLDSFTFSFLLKVSVKIGSVFLGKQIHSSAVKHGLESHLFVRNNLIHLYGFFGELDNAVLLFEEMPERDLVSWNTLIGCHVDRGKCREALGFYSRMFRGGFRPDDATFVVVLSACSRLGALEIGRRFHSLASVFGLKNVVTVSNSLVHMYAICGAIGEAYVMFERTKSKTVVTWNTMIIALATHGRENEVLAFFSKMIDEDKDVIDVPVRPDDITFLGVLSACSRGGLVDEGHRFFRSMSRDFGIEPSLKHYGCMVDMLGRAGLVEEAYELIVKMPIECNAIVWRALLASCRVHGNVELGKKVRGHLSQLDPNHSGDNVLLADMFASTGRWNEVIRVRDSMKDKRVRKPKPGISLVGNSVVH